MKKKQDYNIIFFGTPDIAVSVLEELTVGGIVPSLIVTNPDRPQGRKLELAPSPVKRWAIAQGIATFEPETLTDPTTRAKLKEKKWDLFVVVAYGKIIPKEILDIPKHGVLNVHPSLLPKLRGASPIRSAILTDTKETGVTIMLMDEKLDHGPILAQMKMEISDENWPLPGRMLDEGLARMGGALLADTIPKWLEGEIKPREQNHEEATFSKKITKDMGEIDLEDDPYQNLLKIRAFDGWPGTFFFTEKHGKKIRVKITEAELTPDGLLQINRVIPEGKREMSYEDFMQK